MDLPIHFRSSAASSSSSYTLNPRNLLFVLRDLLDTYLYPPHPLLHDTDVGRIYTASYHFWSSTLYGRKPSSSPVPAAVSRIPNSWHYQRQDCHVCVLSREMPQLGKVCIYCLVNCCECSNSKRHCLTKARLYILGNNEITIDNVPIQGII